MKLKKIFSEIENCENEMVHTMLELLCIPAIAPENGGKGELKKAKKLMQTLKQAGFNKIERHYAKDERVPSKHRPNIVAYCNGENTEEKLWIVTHLDVVPPGDKSLWTVTPPFDPKIKEGRIYGRGSEDNAQSLIASLYGIKTLIDLNITPKRTVALAFVADEEQGSDYGIKHLINEGLFDKKDLVVVPDSGETDGGFIELAEKSILWFRIHTQGKQVHASRPSKGLNAHRAGMEYALKLDKKLHDTYSSKDEQFTPPESTFEPTKKEKNVEAVNVVPGEDLIYFDCRILPRYSLKEVIRNIHQSARRFEEETETKIHIDILQKNSAAKPTDSHSRIVVALKEAIQKIKGINPRVGGIGGGTCASFFRREGIPTVVWSTIDETAHKPNEYSRISNLVNDAKVFAYLALS